MKTNLLLTLFLLSCLNLFSQTVPSYIPTSGLVAWYPFNGNANDESGNGNNGVVNGGVTLTSNRNNTANTAYAWPTSGGTTNFINIGNIHTLTPLSISISAWIFMDGGSLGPRIISSGEVGIGTPTSNNINRTFNINFATSQINSVAIPSLSWQHLLYTYDNTTGDSRLYINGILTNYTPNGVRTTYNYVAWNIGRKSISAFDSWGGKIDDVAIWSRNLTSSEVTNVYNANTLAIAKSELLNYKIYPNPVINKLNIDIEN